MDEQLIQDYFNLIQQLLSCPSGQEMKILHANSLLIDQRLAKEIENVAAKRMEEGEADAEIWKKFATQLIELIETWNKLNQGVDKLHKGGEYEQATILGQQAVKLARQVWGNKHPFVATSLNNLAGVYESQGHYSKAEELYRKAFNLRISLFGEEHSLVADSLNNLGNLYFSQGDSSKAKSLLVKALAIRRSLLGKNHSLVADSLNNLGNLYFSQGDYSQAENLLLDALKIYHTLQEEEHLDAANCLNNLAVICESQGRYSEAESFFLKALNNKKQILGFEHPDVAFSINNLANFYCSQKYYFQAESLLIEALQIYQDSVGEEHPLVSTVLNSIAILYSYQGRYLEAEEMYKKALAMRKHLFGKENRLVANILDNLAGLYSYQGRYSESMELLVKALKMYKGLLGETHPDVADSLNNLAILYTATAQPLKALSSSIEASKIDDKMISCVFAFSSENDRLEYLQKIRLNFSVFLSLVYAPLSDYPQAAQEALDLVLKRKALTASALAAQNEALHSDRYPHLTEDFRKLHGFREHLIHLTFYTPQIDEISIYEETLVMLQAEHNHLQKNLASQVPEIQLQEQLPSRSDVAAELPAGSILIEFVRFDVFNFKAIPAKGEAQWQSARYLAFILPAGQPESVEMVDIGEAEYIDSLIQEFRELRSRTVSKGGMWSSTRRLSFKQYDPQAGIKLRQAIFDKLRPALKEHQHLIIAPDGELNLVPFQILPNDDTGEKMLMDEFTISYLSVGRDILRPKIETKRPASLNALVLASPNFDLSAESVTSNAAREQNTQTSNLRECIANKPLKPAVGTNILGERVAQKFKVVSYLRNEALESYFKPLKCPRILLVATHGVFLPNQPEDRSPTFPYKGESDLLQRDHFFGRVENPMLRSALALAGANTWAKGGKLPPEAGKGILFAQDIAGLDLWANEITVLSACETGIGDVAIGEGVFGLRRAFAVAGAKTLIMSLWSVNGWTTALLMERFFDNCEAGNGRAAALQEAQNYVRNITVGELQQFELGQEILKYEFNNGRELDTAILARQAEDKPLAHPYYWGAWICQGDTTSLPFTACS